MSDVASDASSSYYGNYNEKAAKTDKRAIVEKGKLLLSFSGRPRRNAARRSRHDAAEGRESYLHAGAGSYTRHDADSNARKSRNHGKDAEERRSSTSSIITGGTVGRYDALEKSADWQDAGSPTRKRKDAAASSSQHPKGANEKKNAGDGDHRRPAPSKNVNHAPSAGSPLPPPSSSSSSRESRRLRGDAGQAAANQKSMMVAALLLFLWFCYSFVLSGKKPCVSCLFGASSVDGGTPKF